MAAKLALTFNPISGAFDEVTVGLSPSGITGGTPFAFAGYDASGALNDVQGWSFDATGQVLGFLTSVGASSATSLQVGATISSPLSGGYEGVIVSGDFSSTMTFQSSFNVENTYESGFVMSGGVQQYQDQSQIQSGSDVDNYTSYNSGPTISGTVSNGVRAYTSNSNVSAPINSFVGLSESSSFNSGGSISGDYHGLNLTPNFHTGFTLRSFTGVDINPQISVPVTDDVSGLRISLQNINAGTSLTGISVNVNGSTSNDPQGPKSIEAQGRIDVNTTNDLISGQTFQIGNRIESLLHVAPGSPVTGTDSLGNNFAGDLEAEDDLGLGPIGIGWNSVGFIASVAIAAGKTVDKATVFLPAMSLPDPGSFATGGAITDLGMIRVYAPLAQGGTAVFGDVYGLQINPEFGNLPGTTGNWGVWVGDTNADNWFAKDVVIGGTTGKPTASAALDVTGNSLLNGTVTIPPFAVAGVVLNNSSGVLSTLPPGTAGNVLTSTGSAWTSSPAPTGGSGNGIWDPVDVVATANQALTGAVPLVIDGVTLTSPMRALLAGQTAAPDNGVYAYTDNGTTYTLARATDASTSGQYVNGKLVMVTDGGLGADTLWTLDTANPITLGTTALSFINLTSGLEIAVFNETQALGTYGGSATTGSWVTRVLNTTQQSQPWASLSSNQITLAPGTYFIEGYAPAVGTDNTQAKIANITAASDAALGQTSSFPSANNSGGTSIVLGQVSISSSTVFELQQQFAFAKATFGLGAAASFGPEVYSILKISKVSSGLGSGGGSSLLYTIDGPNSSTIQGDVTVNLAAGLNAHAEGSNTSASADYAHAEGLGSVASGIASHAEGVSLASNTAAHSEGAGHATGAQSHAEGNGVASATRSHAEGDFTIASGLGSHAEGHGSAGKGATGQYSHSEGSRTLASGDQSHAEGDTTTASGLASHSGGVESISSGDISFAQGEGATSQAYASVAIGRFNILQGTPGSSVAGDDAFVIGNGPSLGLESNAFSVSNDGTVKTYGHIRSNQTTSPTVAVTGNAGTGGSASIANATDTAGAVTIVTGTLGLSTGSYANITFNNAYTTAPIVILTPANGTISTSVYVTSSTTGFSINFAVAGGISSTYILNYMCIETQP